MAGVGEEADRGRELSPDGINGHSPWSTNTLTATVPPDDFLHHPSPFRANWVRIRPTLGPPHDLSHEESVSVPDVSLHPSPT